MVSPSRLNDSVAIYTSAEKRVIYETDYLSWPGRSRRIVAAVNEGEFTGGCIITVAEKGLSCFAFVM